MALEFGKKFIQQQICKVYNLSLFLPKKMEECAFDVIMLNITNFRKGSEKQKYIKQEQEWHKK